MNDIQHIASPGSFKTPPLSAATRFGDLLFISATPGYYADGSIDEDEFDKQFDQAVAALRQVLVAAGGSMRSLLKVNVLLTRQQDVVSMNLRYAEAFGPAPYPARTTSIVMSLPDPRMLLEIECVGRTSGS